MSWYFTTHLFLHKNWAVRTKLGTPRRFWRTYFLITIQTMRLRRKKLWYCCDSSELGPHFRSLYTPPLRGGVSVGAPHSLLKSKYSGRKKCNLGNIATLGLILAREKRGLARKARKALPRTQGTVLFQNLGQLVFFYPTGWHKEW